MRRLILCALMLGTLCLASVSAHRLPTRVQARESGQLSLLANGQWGILNGGAVLYNTSYGALAFDFPGPGRGVNYLYRELGASFGRPLGLHVVASVWGSVEIRHDVTGEPASCRPGPATVRLFVWAMRFTGPWGFDWSTGLRWWSNPAYGELTNGRIVLDVPLDWRYWSSVYGERDATQFEKVLVDRPLMVGMTFGGGCAFGHGVYANGASQFAVHEFRVY